MKLTVIMQELHVRMNLNTSYDVSSSAIMAPSNSGLIMINYHQLDKAVH